MKAVCVEALPALAPFVRSHRAPVKFVLAGGIAACGNLFSLFLLKEYGGFHYLAASVTAFLIGATIAFTLHKWWTFREETHERIPRQVFLHLMTQGGSLLANTAIVFLLVEYVQVWYLLAQIVSGLALALVTYTISKYYIFVA
ncbi:MAG: hypothetical protein A2542_01780 [Parcubacteria group bacterium RIFOXYD2_FULL_52_8]|nr:MAG: hypothetical protein A2542_01780 [Parcubacteria group bacterium RIFOXYD2_FULL_52_8]